MLRVPALPSNVVRELSFAGRARPVAPSVPAIRPRDAALAIMRSLSNADVRALAALVASPSLIASSSSPVALLDDGWRLATLLERREWLTALDADPSSLIAHLARSNARQLGRYAARCAHDRHIQDLSVYGWYLVQILATLVCFLPRMGLPLRG